MEIRSYFYELASKHDDATDSKTESSFKAEKIVNTPEIARTTSNHEGAVREDLPQNFAVHLQANSTRKTTSSAFTTLMKYQNRVDWPLFMPGAFMACVDGAV